MRLVRSIAVVIALAPLGVHAQTTVVGATPGSFRVSESGAAEYRIPIRVPPGIGGMEPKLALVYNSQTGNGPLGVGWGLAGLSVVTRCPRTVAQDGFRGGVHYDLNDRYCLDGQRLIAIAGSDGADGTEYRTERETFSKVISYGTAGDGPAWFRVWTKSGHVMEYGNTADSRIEAVGKPTARVWAVNKVSDTKGTYLTVSYAEDSAKGEFHPARIDYTANDAAGAAASRSVRFTYQDRTDTSRAFQGGSVIEQTKRLASIQTYASATDLITEYRVAYTYNGEMGRSLVQTITECDGSGACLAPTTPQWQAGGGATFINAERRYHSGSPYTWGWRTLADVNGDGMDDLVLWNSTSTGVYVVPADGAGGFDHDSRKYHPGTPFTWPWRALADVNGDGMADLVLWTDAYNGVYVIPADGSGGFDYNRRRYHTGTPFEWPWRTLADVNGDGMADLVLWSDLSKTLYVIPADGNGGFDYDRRRYHTDAAFAWEWRTLADVNGDGMADLVTWQNNTLGVYVIPADGNGGFDYGRRRYHGDGAFKWPWRDLADVNGDGMADLVTWSNNTLGVYVIPADGDGGFDYSRRRYNDEGAFKWPWRDLADVNGDGMADLVTWNNNTLGVYVLPADGKGGFDNARRRYHSEGLFQWPSRRLGDVNGDGKADIVTYNSTSYGVYSVRSAAPYPDLMVSITDGLGRTASLDYKPLTDSSVYSKDSGLLAAAYPNVDVQDPLYVVGSSTLSGSGTSQSTTHGYAGLKKNYLGRGLLGYRSMSSTDDQTGLKSTAEFRQDWPYVGLPFSARRTQSSGAVLSDVANSYQCTDPATSGPCIVAPGNRYFPHLIQSLEAGNDLNGTVLPTVTTGSQYDEFGNATQVTVSAGDGYSKSTSNIFVNDVPNWLLGRLKSSTVQSTVP